MDDLQYRWRGALTDAEMVGLVLAHGGRAQPGWWDQIRPHSLGWVTARGPGNIVAGFANVAWDGVTMRSYSTPRFGASSSDAG